ncbi:hypothetical protein KUCAC02_033340, partial [Chaenocephalus aceratus]
QREGTRSWESNACGGRTMVTNRHRQIAKWLRETSPHIEHLNDIWHGAKASKAAVKLETLVCNKIPIAALHFNENANRVQGVTKAGEAMYSIKYPKGRTGAAVLRRVLESPTYGE